jgi:hypothetical protein
MRVVLTAVFLLAAAGLVDAIWFDGTYRAAVVDQSKYQGQMFTYQVDRLVRKVISP